MAKVASTKETLTENLSVRISTAAYRQLVKRAAADNRTVSNLARVLLEQALKEEA